MKRYLIPALFIVAGLLPLSGVAEALPLRMRLANPAASVRLQAIGEVTQMPNPDPELIGALIRLLDAQEEIVRTQAANGLLRHGKRDVFEHRLRNSRNLRSQMEALLVLRSTLSGLEDPELRKEAARLHELAQLYIDPPLVAPAAADPVQDGQFDKGGFAEDWELLLTGNAKATVTPEPELGRTSPGSLKVVRENAEGEVVLRSKRPLHVPAGKTPAIRFYYHADDAGDAAFMQIYLEDRKGRRFTAPEDMTSITAESQSFIRNAPAGKWNKRVTAAPRLKQPEDYHVLIVFKGNPATVWIDDFAAPAPAYRYQWPAGSVSVSENRNAGQTATAPVAQQEGEVAAVRVVSQGGQPRLLVNGKPIAPVLYMTQRSDMGDYAAAEQLGKIPLIVPNIPLVDVHDPRFGERRPVWTGAMDTFDFDEVLEAVDRAAADAPDSLLILRLDVQWPTDWGELNPDQVWLNAKGQRGYGTHLHFEGFGDTLPRSNTRWWPSPSSDKALEDASLVIGKLVAELRTKPYFNRIAGCHISGGHDGQFFTGAWPDYSQPAQQAFRSWLENRYGSDKALQTAWNRRDVTLATAQIPDYDAVRSRASSQGMQFLDPSRDQAVADHQEFQAERGILIREALARAFRQAMGRDTVGMTWQIGGGRGQGAERLFLNSDSLDMMVTQPAYSLRLPGQVGGLRAMLGSLGHYGKLSIKEMDLRTWLRTGGAEVQAMRLGAAMTPEDFRNIFKREAAQMIAAGHGFWMYDIVPLHFRDPDIYEAVAEAVRAYEDLVLPDAEPFRPDVAVAWSDTSRYWLADAMYRVPATDRLEAYTAFHINRAGVPYDSLFLSDLLQQQQQGHPYKMVVIGDAWRLDDRQRAELKAVLQKGGTTVVWNYAPGYLSDSGTSLAAVEELAGMRLAATPTPEFIGARFIAGGDPLTKGVDGVAGTGEMAIDINEQRSGDRTLGRQFARFAVTDPQAVPLARYNDGKTAIAVRRFNDWTSVFHGMPGMLDTRLLNRIAREAGATVLSDAGPAVAFNGRFLSIHATANGPVEITLPFAADVVAFEDGTAVASGTDRFTLPMQTGETRWFSVTPAAAD